MTLYSGSREMVERELRRRYPEYEGEPAEHPDYQELCAEVADFLSDVWYYEPWDTVAGERETP